MSCKIISFNLSPKSSSQISSLKSTSSQLSFTTNLQKSKLFFKTSSKSYKFSVKAAGATLETAPAQTETFYDLLGVSDTVSVSDIKKAYKKMAFKYHPDVSPPDRVDEYTTRFIQVQEAYHTLSDPDARAVYDNAVANGFSFSGRMGTRFDRNSDITGGWKSRWQVQIMELKKKRVIDSKVDRNGQVSWGARIRNKQTKPF